LFARRIIRTPKAEIDKVKSSAEAAKARAKKSPSGKKVGLKGGVETCE